MASFWAAIVKKWTANSLPITTLDLSGRTVIITGANIGLGYEAAKHFYSMNPARLIIAVRNLSKGEEAKRSLINDTKESRTTNIEIWELDLASFESTLAFVKRCDRELGRLDVFLANAGMATREWKSTEDEWEATIQTNVLSTFLLAALLVPLLKKTAKLSPPVAAVHLKPHLVIVASEVHTWAQFPERSATHILNTLNNKDKFIGGDRYNVSKLLDIFLTRQLAQSEQLKDGQVVVCSVTPGFCRSELMREVPWLFRHALYALIAKTTEQGSRAYLWASLTDDIPPGSYSSSCAIAKPSPFVESPEGAEVQQKLWDEMADILVKVAPETGAVWKVAA